MVPLCSSIARSFREKAFPWFNHTGDAILEKILWKPFFIFAAGEEPSENIRASDDPPRGDWHQGIGKG